MLKNEYYNAMRTQVKNKISWIVVVSCLCIISNAEAQPTLTINRVVNKWPTIELFYSVICDGQPAYPSSKNNYKVYENGDEITEYMQWCPDPSQRCAISVSLVLDAGSSMAGNKNQYAKDGASAFVNLMDGILDESTIIWYNDQVAVEQQMGTNKHDMLTAVNNLPSSGVSSVWDGAYVGISELVANSHNPCRAMIILSNGTVTGGTHTPDNVVAIALKNRIRVYAISLESGTNAQLESVAQLSGGRYYRALNSAEVVQAYEEISSLCYKGFDECMIVYDAKCMDGSMRTVDLLLYNYCHGGSDKKSKTYRAPKDTTTYQNIVIRAEDVEKSSGESVDIQFNMVTSLQTKTQFTSLTCVVEYDPDVLVYYGTFPVMQGMLSGCSFNATDYGGEVRIYADNLSPAIGAEYLFCMIFYAKYVPTQTKTQIGIKEWSFETGCYTVSGESGIVTVNTIQRPVLTLTGRNPYCEDNPPQLTASDGFRNYVWQNCSVGNEINVSGPGMYYATAETVNGFKVNSDTVMMYAYPTPKPRIEQSSPLEMCEGDVVVLSADSGYIAYTWSNGATGRVMSADVGGEYFVSVTDTNGCEGVSEAVRVITKQNPMPVIKGKNNVCRGDVCVYTIENASATSSYEWSAIDGKITGGQDKDTVQIEWAKAAHCSVKVLEYNENGCSGVDSISINVTELKPSLIVDGTLTICSGQSVTLRLGESYPTYLWSTGESTANIIVDKEGDYYCTISANGCTAITDTVHVTKVAEIDVNVKGETIVCPNTLVKYTATYVDGAAYAWFPRDGKIIMDDDDTVIVRWNDMSTQGRLIGYMELGMCQYYDTIYVEIKNVRKPGIMPGGTVALCYGNSLKIEAESGMSDYLWSTGDTGRSIMVDVAGKYFFTAMDTGGCMAYSDTMTLNVTHSTVIPIIYVNSGTEFCKGDSVIIEGENGYSDILWSTGDTNRVIQIYESGEYYYSARDTNGCILTSDTITMTAHSVKTPVITQSGTILSCTPEGMARYDWYKDGVLLKSDTIPIVTAQGDGLYTVIVTDALGCTATSTPHSVTGVGTYTPSLASVFNIVPNPSGGLFDVVLSFTDPCVFSYRIINIAGQMVYSENITGRYTSYRKSIRLDNEPKGVYFFLLESSKGYDVRKIVIR